MEEFKVCGKYVRVYDRKRKRTMFEHDKKWLDSQGLFNLNSITEYGDGNYVIHHIDGNRGNNDLKNLQLMTRSEHTSYHSKRMTKETREKLSKASKGRKYSTEIRKKFSEAQKRNPSRPMLGKRHSDETKQKMRDARNKHWANVSQEEKDRRNELNRQWHLGKSPANKGIPCPEHQRQFLSEYWKQKYKDGYISPTKGKVAINNGEICKKVPKQDLDKYLSDGYVRGMLKRQITEVNSSEK